MGHTASGVSLAYLTNQWPREFGAAVALAWIWVLASWQSENTVGVRSVLGGGRKLQICQPVIVLVPVLVVDLHVAWDEATKGLIN